MAPARSARGARGGQRGASLRAGAGRLRRARPHSAGACSSRLGTDKRASGALERVRPAGAGLCRAQAVRARRRGGAGDRGRRSFPRGLGRTGDLRAGRRGGAGATQAGCRGRRDRRHLPLARAPQSFARDGFYDLRASLRARRPGQTGPASLRARALRTASLRLARRRALGSLLLRPLALLGSDPCERRLSRRKATWPRDTQSRSNRIGVDLAQERAAADRSGAARGSRLIASGRARVEHVDAEASLWPREPARLRASAPRAARARKRPRPPGRAGELAGVERASARARRSGGGAGTCLRLDRLGGRA